MGSPITTRTLAGRIIRAPIGSARSDPPMPIGTMGTRWRHATNAGPWWMSSTTGPSHRWPSGNITTGSPPATASSARRSAGAVCVLPVHGEGPHHLDEPAEAGRPPQRVLGHEPHGAGHGHPRHQEVHVGPVHGAEHERPHRRQPVAALHLEPPQQGGEEHPEPPEEPVDQRAAAGHGAQVRPLGHSLLACGGAHCSPPASRSATRSSTMATSSSTTSSMESSEVSTVTASPAVASGLSRRPESAASRRAMSAATSS